MWSEFKEQIRTVLKDKSGERFQNYYRHHNTRKDHRHSLFVVLAAPVCFIIAIVLSVTPGPAFVFWIIGFALISSQFLPVARMMDRIEVAVLKIFKKGKTTHE